MHISKDLLWLEPYMDAARHMIPKLKYLRRLTSKAANKKLIQRVHGICWKYADGKNFKICLYTSKTKVHAIKPIQIHLIQYSKIELLITLAHELAHLEHWDHTPDHKSLECAIALIFMNMLKAEGYISEENEAKLVRGFKIS